MGNLNRKKNTILYVDDSEANIFLFKESFQYDYRILTALSGEEDITIV